MKILVGNKCDLVSERQVTWEDGVTTAEACNIELQFEASALPDKRDTVESVFREVILTLVKSNP